MEVAVSFRSELASGDAIALDELSDALTEDGIANQKIKQPVQAGQKDGGLTMGIAITGAVLSSISTVIAVLNFWLSTRPKYKITVTRGNASIELQNPTREELQNAIGLITSGADQTKPEIVIANR